MTWLSRNWGKLILFALSSFVILRVLDLLSLKWLYEYFATTFSDIGITNQYLVSALGVAMMTITALLTGELFSNIVLRRTKEGTAVAGLALVTWLLFLYLLTLPKDGEYINPVTGEHRFVYVILPNGEIDIKPLGYKFHPETGQAMQPLTPYEITRHREKIERWEKRKNEPGLGELLRLKLEENDRQKKAEVRLSPELPPVAINNAEYPPFTLLPEWSRYYGKGFNIREWSNYYYDGCALMRVDSLHLHEDSLCLIVSFWNDCNSGKFSLDEPEGESTYIVTDQGEALKLLSYRDIYTHNSTHYYLVPGEKKEGKFTFSAPTKPLKRLNITHDRFRGLFLVLRS
jgi:hypothetical protein